MKKPDFLHVDTDLWKLKVNCKILVWVWPLWSHDSKKLVVSQEGINRIN